MSALLASSPMDRSTNIFNNTPARQNFFGNPEVNGNPARFSLVPAEDGRSRFAIDTSNLNSPYFRASKRSRTGEDGSYAGRPSGVADMASYGSFGKPSLEAVPTVGFMSNHTVPGNSTVLHSVDKADELPGPNDVVVLRTSMGNERQRWRSVGDMVVDDTARDAWTIPAFNRYLAINQKKRTVDTIDTSVEGLNWDDPVSILAHFYVYGIVEDGDTMQNFTFTSRVGDTQHFTGSEDRRVGVVISGRKQCFNLWGPNVPAGASLFIILKPITRPNAYMTNGHDRRHLSKRIISSAEAYDLADRPFQLVPYASMLKAPPRAELRYFDHRGLEQEAPYVTFATGYKHPELSTELNPLLAARDITFSRGQGLIDVIVHGAV